MSDNPEQENQSDKGKTLSTFDFMSIKGAGRRILRLMMKKPGGYQFSELVGLIAEMPESKQISEEELVDVLDEFIDKGWIEENHSEEETTYRINMGPKIGSDVSRAPRPPMPGKKQTTGGGPRMKDLWDSIDDTLKGTEQEVPSKSKLRTDAALQAMQLDEPDQQKEDEEKHSTKRFTGFRKLFGGDKSDE